MSETCLSVILAAGEGTRMKSAVPKVLHKIGGLPLVCHVVRAMQAVSSRKMIVVVGSEAEIVAAAVRPFVADVAIVEQKKRLGTAHAVLAAREELQKSVDDVLIAFGDTPLIEETALADARKALKNGADIVAMGFRTNKPMGYGRLVEKGGQLIAIVEEKDANEAQKKITFCNGGLMAIKGKHLLSLLDKVKYHNANREYYLTDIIPIGAAEGLDIRVIEAPEDNFIGINTRAQLADAEVIWQNRKRQALMLAGVTLQAPETVFFSYDTEIADDVLIEPYVFFGPGVKVAIGAIIHAFSHIEGAIIGENAEIGPYARLRFGAHLKTGVKVGNFCEIKKTEIGTGAKINHLTYIGDAEIGAYSNIGAGTITCNYDGYNKWKTAIGERAFIGSNSSLVAPISIGNGAYVASGSVITENIADDALAFGRARQVNKSGQAKILREHCTLIKQGKKA
ncbi:MAG: bifunctional UDP-N-acetylglucosamine pyrophosphorylase / Glucosamine-1-phosphate N-acetyltransferase [Candidatus Tokpelaia sp. JSC189]|nr:MAG: bifunctional UDP-N-acetylglucosamine pyrophosphorylase / Glucosamine-1-phosphate N-acetyltransferase [Candidatus Tokpelaia sp. JSC189]